MFLLHLCESMGIDVELPVKVCVDKAATIFMSQNVTTEWGTKHVQCRGNYVLEYQEDGVIKIVFVLSEDNDSDILTKNLGSELHSMHSKKLIGKK